MDFDPSAFLSMAMTEDQDAEYTAPDNVPRGLPTPEKVSAEKIVVEGGLQMEQDLQIPVPVFGLLQQDDPEGEEEETTGNTTGHDVPMHVDTEHETNTTPQHSPGEKTLSPCNRKIIQTTTEESRFRKELFCGQYERVKLFRLHCTICDRHLGCAPWYTERNMRQHKLLNVVVCRKCFEYYGDINFPIEDGSELYCSWCGEGGECFCCSTCPKIVCKKCVMRNFGPAKIKEIDANDDWSCFVCKPEDIWPHRALMWGLQRWSKGLRQLVAMFPKDEKQAKLSLDTSHCCKEVQERTPLGIPSSRAVLSKIPQCTIAQLYRNKVKDILAGRDTSTGLSNGVLPPNSPITYSPAMNTNQYQHQAPRTMATQPQLLQIPRMANQQQQTQIPRALVNHHQHQYPRSMVIQQPQQMARGVVGYHVRQVIERNTLMMNRPPPYPVNRNVAPPQLQQAPRLTSYLTQPSIYRMLPPQRPELVDLGKNTSNSFKPPLFDISALENSVRDVKKFLQPTLMLLDQFDMAKNELANDFEKLTSFTERVSYNLKIAICNLAKANTDLTENQKKFIDNRVSSVVNNIQSAIPPTVNGNLSTVNHNGIVSRPKGSIPHLNLDSSPEIIEIPPSPSKTPDVNPSVAEQTPSTPVSSTGEDVGEAAIALLCETVLEVGENKVIKVDADKDQARSVKRPSQQDVSTPRKGKPGPKIGRKRQRSKNESSDIQVIDLSDDEEERKKTTFDEAYWCKKFKTVPCQVVLEKLEILKVDIV